MNNQNLQKAKLSKNDLFYTKKEDVEKELVHYSLFLKGKNVYCNCDDPMFSEFWRYFVEHFYELDLKSVTATYYSFNEQHTKLFRLDSNGLHEEQLKSNGDFRSDDCIKNLKCADVIITNPPFSLFREYMSFLIKYNKYFLILGNMNAITYKEVFPLLQNNAIWSGYTKPKTFIQPNGKIKKFGNILWFTNLPVNGKIKKIDINNNYYCMNNYPKYDNYDAIEVSKVANIPCDYKGVMGVPISFFEKYCPKQFKIIGASESEGTGFSNGLWDNNSKIKQPLINGKKVYKRLFIQNVN